MPEPMWKPTADRIEKSNLTAFMKLVNERYKVGVADYASLYRWSIEHAEEFWPTLWDFCGVLSSQRWDKAVVDREKMPGARWFVGAKLNFAENLLRYRDDRTALVFCNESGRQRSLTYRELYDVVARLVVAMRKAGLKEGDRVGGIVPNFPESIIGMLAAASIGAIWSSCSPDFGVQGVFDRFGQIQPKILIAVDGYFYNGKTHDLKERIQGIIERIPSIEKVVIVPYANPNPEINDIKNAILFDDFIGNGPVEPIEFAQFPFDHPLYILYSSGTTGVPKCICHGAGGTLMQHLKELVLHTDLTREDRIIYFTTCGWMMWNWLVSSLAVGATVVLFDGSPTFPFSHSLWDLADREEITVFGTSAKYLAAIEKAHVEPINTHKLTNLRAILSTGSPLAAEQFDYIYSKVKKDVCLSSISGGTDIVSCFALGCPIVPVWRGELQVRGLAMKVEVFGEDGKPVVGEKGELVCTATFPSMPIYFWNDPDGTKYHDAYFDHYPGVWRHGDYCELTEHEGMIIYGRSDATLNPGGVRIGTAEIYRVVEQLPEILESLVIGQDWDNDVRVILFVKLRPEVEANEQLFKRIKNHIRQNATPRHVPAKVIPIAEIPRTISGKIVELAVRNVIHGKPVKNVDALANPQALELYRDLAQLSEP